MNRKQDLKKLCKTIHEAAQLYKNNLVGKDFLYVFDNRFIECRFRIDNFKHFTGVESTLSAKRFYQNALANKLSYNQVYFSKNHPYDLAKKKLKHIRNISTVLTSESIMLENITTQSASYKFGSTNLDCTICLNKEFINGIAKGKHYIGMSLRDEDCFSKSQHQFVITHIFSKLNSSRKYDTILYMEKNSSIQSLNDEIKKYSQILCIRWKKILLMIIKL